MLGCCVLPTAHCTTYCMQCSALCSALYRTQHTARSAQRTSLRLAASHCVWGAHSARTPAISQSSRRILGRPSNWPQPGRRRQDARCELCPPGRAPNWPAEKKRRRPPPLLAPFEAPSFRPALARAPSSLRAASSPNGRPAGRSCAPTHLLSLICHVNRAPFERALGGPLPLDAGPARLPRPNCKIRAHWSAPSRPHTVAGCWAKWCQTARRHSLSKA